MTRACKTWLGKPEVIREMAYGGTRYKYLHGVRIDHMYSRTGREDIFIVSQAGRPGVELGRARTLAQRSGSPAQRPRGSA